MYFLDKEQITILSETYSTRLISIVSKPIKIVVAVVVIVVVVFVKKKEEATHSYSSFFLTSYLIATVAFSN